MIIKSLFERVTQLPETAYHHYAGIFASVVFVDAKTSLPKLLQLF